MTAAATRDDLAGLVTVLTEQAVTQRKWQQEYEAKAAVLTGETRVVFERFAAQAKGTAHAFEVSADMIRKYVSVPWQVMLTLTTTLIAVGPNGRTDSRTHREPLTEQACLLAVTRLLSEEPDEHGWTLVALRTSP